MERSDENILFDCYDKIAQLTIAEKKSSQSKHDECVAFSLEKKVPSILEDIGPESNLTPEEIEEKVLVGKNYYSQYLSAKARSPECVSESLDMLINKLIQLTCIREAEIVDGIREERQDESPIDLVRIFANENNLTRLRTKSVRRVVKDAMQIRAIYEESVPKFYMTPQGKRYHLQDCPHCRGKELVQTSIWKIYDLNLLPCRCVSPNAIKSDSVTVFIDESIRPVAWDYTGQEGYNGIYSYIICRGNLCGEKEIKKGNTILKRVELSTENKNVVSITISAIKKVLLLISYEYGFTGNVRIYTDNKIAVTTWKKSPLRFRYEALFNTVKVDFIPRRLNNKADQLTRERTLLDIPTHTYKKMCRLGTGPNCTVQVWDRLGEEAVFTKRRKPI